ncbi:MAG: 2-methylcitrate dehydratase [Francisellaceae bacterium]|nr:2-methylcitrate dehydratase [Francisellaceae bacterium]
MWAASVFANYTRSLNMGTILTSMTKAYEIQGVLALENAFNRCGLDHVVLVKVASSAVLTNILGGGIEHILSAVSNAWIDGQSLRTYRHGINTGPRKSWAAADAVMRAFNLGWMALFAGEPGYPQALSAKGWGFYDVLFNGNKLEINQKFESYVMDNILLKVSFPAEFHGQTAVECGLKLHKQVKNRLDSIVKINVRTQEAAMRIINKPHKLTNYADRDHCLQYMLAVAMLSGKIDSNSYSDSYANDNPMIEVLREKMHLEEDKGFSADYLAADKRSIANAVKVEFSDGSETDWVKIEYPLGHKRRRAEAKPELKNKLTHALDNLKIDSRKADKLNSLWDMPINEFMNIPINEMVTLCQK